MFSKNDLVRNLIRVKSGLIAIAEKFIHTEFFFSIRYVYCLKTCFKFKKIMKIVSKFSKNVELKIVNGCCDLKKCGT